MSNIRIIGVAIYNTIRCPACMLLKYGQIFISVVTELSLPSSWQSHSSINISTFFNLLSSLDNYSTYQNTLRQIVHKIYWRSFSISPHLWNILPLHRRSNILSQVSWAQLEFHKFFKHWIYRDIIYMFVLVRTTLQYQKTLHFPRQHLKHNTSYII